MLTLLGLKDDYQSDGGRVVEPLYDWAIPQSLRAHRETLLRLGDVYKQLHGVLRLVRDEHPQRVDQGARERLFDRRQHVYDDRGEDRGSDHPARHVGGADSNGA